jgi:hypothetical protein
VLDLAGGGSLAALLARRGRLTVGETITAIAPIGAALAYAHNAGVVHGDVSSANILFTDIGLPLLADLGVARLLGDAQPVRTTPAYADPAVVGGSLPTPASDVFMLGAVALHALTGTPPWDGPGADDLLEAAGAGTQPDFAAALSRAAVPEPVAAVVSRALSVEPARRGTAAEFALELRHAAKPVAVELSAGRARTAAVPPTSRSAPLQAAPSPAEPDRAVARPRQPLTMGVRAPSPFVTPAARHLAHSRPRVATGLMVSAIVVALALCAGVWWWRSAADPAPALAATPSTVHPTVHPTAHPTARASASAASRTALPTAISTARPTANSRDAPARSTSTASSRALASDTATRAFAPARLDPAHALATLTALDETRSQAYATRNPALLTAVYASPTLLGRDRAQLLSIVPAGCRLLGVRTRFSQLVFASASAIRVRLRVRTTITASRLVCSGAAGGSTPGAAPTTLLLDLVRSDSSYRIAAATATTGDAGRG